MRPRLKREKGFFGDELALALHLPFACNSGTRGGCTTPKGSLREKEGAMETSPFWGQEQPLLGGREATDDGDDGLPVSREREGTTQRRISRCESILSSHPPIMESLLAQLPTTAILNLYHTSKSLQSFLKEYPLAWRALSFRLPQAAINLTSPGMDMADSRERQSKQHALDSLLMQVVMPVATRLRSLDLDNTAIGGMALISNVVQPRIHTLQHLSVRGCKNVSIKYHIVPFLHMHSPSSHPLASKIALKSLYTYRCRHHRRRPYLPSSLVRRDSDSEPTHELIEICHQLGIWTDTAWCPTPGGRCYRRKDYHGNRAAPGTQEVWVPFDRLWRSGNRIGPVDDKRGRTADGRLWEDNELGHDGEALGTESFVGDGKYAPAHSRSSHATFVDDVKCDQCGDAIMERCETCSIKMHCMGCRKTLCASCSFNRPIPRKRAKIRHFPSLLGSTYTSISALTPLTAPPLQPTVHSQIGLTSTPQRGSSKRDTSRFWWAPGSHRSPNLMSELPADSDSEEEQEPSPVGFTNHIITPAAPLKLNMHWCCIEPIFSGGGGVAFLGPGQMGGSGSDRIRAVPLPKRREYEDPDFQHTLVDPSSIEKLKNVRLYEEIMGENVDILPYLMQDTLDLQTHTCPRSLCQDCYRSFRWRVACRGCKRPMCKEHDFRGLKVRKCGYRDLGTERDYVRNPPPPAQNNIRGSGRWDLMAIPAFRRTRGPAAGTDYGSGASTPVPMNDDDDTTTPMARIASTASSSADSSQLLAPTSTPTGLESALAQLDMAASFMDLHRSQSTAGSSRQRSASLSDASGPSAARTGVDWHKRYLLPGSNGHPVQWQGCGSYFCQTRHPAGDNRTNCSSELRDCKECGVLVCEYCLLDVSPCPCTVCSSVFHCPVCTNKPHVRAQCTRDDELRAIETARERERERLIKQEEDRAVANETAEAVGEFFQGMTT